MIVVDTTKQLGTDPILKLIVKFSIPSIISMTVNAIYNIVDRIFVGKLVGENALGGLTVVFPLMMIVFSLGTLFGIGGSALISIKFGEQDKVEPDKIFGNMITLLTVGSLAVTILCMAFLTPLLKFVGATDAVIPYAREYFWIILIGTPFQLMSFALAALVRVQGKPMLSMATQLISAITNIILDYIFIGPLHLGVAGAAWATVIGMFVGFCILFHFFFMSGNSLLKFHFTNLKLKLDIVKRICSIGMSSFFMNIGNSVSATFVIVALGTYGGDSALTSMGAIQSLFTICLMPIFGMQQGLGPIIGYNYGMKQYQRVRKTLFTGVGLAAVFSMTLFLLFELFPTVMATLFIDPNSSTMAVAEVGLRCQMAVLPFLPISVLGTAFFQSVGQGFKALILSVTRQLMCIPAVLILPRFLSLTGVWFSGPIGELTSVTLAITFLLTSPILKKRDEIEVVKEEGPMLEPV